MNQNDMRYVDMRNVNPQIKNETINQNNFNFVANNGLYRNLPSGPTFKRSYEKNFSSNRMNNGGVGDPDCNVAVMHMNPLDILESLSSKGIEALKDNCYPLIMHPVHKMFDGKLMTHSNGVYDERLVLRSNYYTITRSSFKYYPLQRPEELVYINKAIVIRDNAYNNMNYDQLYPCGVATVTPDISSDLLDIDGMNCLTASDYMPLQRMYEAVFQTAIEYRHNCVIIPMLPTETNIPFNDQIRILNLCILQYSTFLQGIIIAIPLTYSNEHANYFNEHIIKIQDIVESVEMELEGDIISGKFIPDPDEVERLNIEKMKKIEKMTDEEKIQLAKKKIHDKRKKNKRKRKR